MSRSFSRLRIVATHLKSAAFNFNQVRFDWRIYRSRGLHWTSDHDAARFVNEVTTDRTAGQQYDQDHRRDRHRRRSFFRRERDINARKRLGCAARQAVATRDHPGALNVGRAAVASELVGVGEEAFARTATYLKERKQFGKPIGEFQALQHRAAHLYSEIEITRATVLKALQTLDEHFDHAGLIVSVAKARAGASATLAVQEAVQMHGGIGMTDEFDIGFYMKRARVAQELFGDFNFHADQLARLNRY